MRRSQKTQKNNLKLAAWNTFGAACWVYSIYTLAKKEKEVDSTNCKNWLKKVAHICYKADYMLFGCFAAICGYLGGKALAKAFTPDPDKDQEVTNKKEVE